MQLKKLTREGKEKLYIDTIIKLEKYWGCDIPKNWENTIDFKLFSDNDLEKNFLDDIRLINSIKTDKFIDFLINLVIYIFVILIIFWIIWLLIFWIKQLFWN